MGSIRKSMKNLYFKKKKKKKKKMLPPRGSFVIVKFRVSLYLSRNIIRVVRSLYHMILENVCMDVCVYVCTYTALSPDLRGRF